ncbi:MAG: DegV family protein [Clostridia bacterium]
MSFWIVTDVCCDLPASYTKMQKALKVSPMSYQQNGESLIISPADEHPEQTAHVFYDHLRQGGMATTSQINQIEWQSIVKPLLKDGQDVLMLVFSSGLSGTCGAAKLAVDELREKFPDRKIFMVDSVSASMGEGLFVHHMLKYRDAGNDIDACYAYAKQLAPRIIHWFTVDDLQFLRRGGRISATSAYLGSMLKIKPVLNVDPKGRLMAREKVQGRKKSLRTLFEKVKLYADQPAEQTLFISHGDCLEDAQWLENKLREELGVKDILISVIGPIIGAHAGPGTVAVFFVGKTAEGRLDAPAHA